jgi:hypothetical protein
MSFVIASEELQLSNNETAVIPAKQLNPHVFKNSFLFIITMIL